jgi:hypothetical protein
MRSQLKKRFGVVLPSLSHEYSYPNPPYDDRKSTSVEFRVLLAQAIEQSIVFVGAGYKHVRIHEANGSTNILLLG